MTQERHWGRWAGWLSAAALAAGAPGAMAQSNSRAVFVANNGNLEGSVTSYRVNADGTVSFVQKLVTGTRPNTSTMETGCNAVDVSLTPNGKYLATSHAAGDYALEQISLIEVFPNGTMVQIAELFTPQTPLHLAWVDNEYLAVLETDLSGPNNVHLYRVDPEIPSMTLTGTVGTGSFTVDVVRHPSLPVIYVGDTGTNRVYVCSIGMGGALSLLQSPLTGGVYPFGMAVSPNGQMLFGGGGISAGGEAIVGFSVGPTGLLTLLPGSPYTSPGASPNVCGFSEDGAILFVGHGTDATVRSFFVDYDEQDLVSTGWTYDVGLQGTHGDLATIDNLLMLTDNSTAIDGVSGLRSFAIMPNGTATENGTIVSSTGVTPDAIAVWDPCLADWTGEGTVSSDDFIAYLADFGDGVIRADISSGAAACGTPDGNLNSDDFICYLQLFAAGCS